MKNIIIFLLFSGFLIPLVAQGQLFKDQTELKESFAIGTYNYYESIYRKNGYQPLQKGQDTISFPYSVGVKMSVVGGTFWVAQKPRTIFVTENKKIVKRYDCDNKISGFCYLPQPQPEEKKVPEKEKEVIKKSLAELKIELNYYDNSKNTFISDTSIPDSPFNPFHITNLLWEVPVVGVAVLVIIKLLSHHDNETQKSFSSGGILPPN
jgi:hypothetical protein